MTSPIDRALTKARLQPRPYTDAEMAAAQSRIAARIAARMMHGALSFDDQMQPVLHQAVLPRPLQNPDRLSNSQGLRRDAARDLRTLCQTVVSQEGALHQLQIFVSRHVLDPDGAVVLGCVLQLATREDSARFWWQFAAGAGDTAAAYCLSLHHRALGEFREAQWWHQQAHPAYRPSGPTEFIDRHDLLGVVRLLGALRGQAGKTVDFPAATTAVIDYVPDALGFVDEVDLPLPDPDFAERIEELTTA